MFCNNSFPRDFLEFALKDIKKEIKIRNSFRKKLQATFTIRSLFVEILPGRTDLMKSYSEQEI